MPELPEVETVCRGLEKKLCGRAIKNVTLHRSDLRIPFPKTINSIKNSRINSISRRAKYILINMTGGQTMIVHLGMSGRMTVTPGKVARGKHDHMVLQMDDGTAVTFNDPRRFGLVDLAETKSLPQHRLFRHLGPEPLERAFSANYLAQKLKDKKTAVKIALMDQRVVVGVGNIYASEALFMSGIDPSRPAGTLKANEIKELVTAIRAVLKKAIRAGGSSLRDYVQADGELGYFQHQFAVYDREGEGCRGCICNIRKTGGVQRITQGGRSTFYCPVKQG